MNNITQLRNKLEQQKGQRFQIEQSLTKIREELRNKKRSLIRHEKAREVVRTVGLTTQNQISYHISDITSLALEAVFPNPYSLQVEFIQRRNKTECDLFFVRDGMRIDPITASGVGAVDIAAFALRIASWSMAEPKSSNTILLDEPFKHLKGEIENRKALDMIKKISDKLKMQIIMVSDERISREATIEATDKLFEVSIKNGKTRVRGQGRYAIQ